MVSNLIKNLAPSKTLALTEKIAQQRAEGRDVLAFNLGEPDFNTPSSVVAAAERAMRDGRTRYTPVAGIQELRAEICSKLQADNSLSYVPSQICVSAGAKQALINSLMAICNPGDEVVIFTPCWVSYPEMIKIAGAVPVLVRTEEGNDFQPRRADLERALTSAARAVIINSPNNPTGVIYSEETIRMIAGVAENHNLTIISDEIYEKLIYSAERPFSPAAASDYAAGNTVTINGFSKSHAMTGWRIGYSAAPPEIAGGIASFQSHTTSNANTISQYAALSALRDCRDDVEEMRKAFDERRKYLYNRLKAVRGIECVESRGAFYLMPNVSGFYGKKTSSGRILNDSIDFCDYMLSEALIAVVPGEAFESPDNIRISYAVSLENIIKGIDSLESAVSRLS